ncbi:hypothetical protein PoB_005664600 [Plakobranchus ocellatus]|uniref:Uncharacterized protein n=1 Tax=Plakobranchus ocellatus TaxID=259542 RepID=A0AAV4CBN0_9GAST|nr:hypothetical protein PoB_005664600 [Plakobranchus ocellatus]
MRFATVPESQRTPATRECVLLGLGGASMDAQPAMLATSVKNVSHILLLLSPSSSFPPNPPPTPPPPPLTLDLNDTHQIHLLVLLGEFWGEGGGGWCDRALEQVICHDSTRYLLPNVGPIWPSASNLKVPPLVHRMIVN